MGLRVHNSLTRQREDFVPLDPPRVGVYVCGPTVYGHSHLGHAKSYVGFDAVVRWLRFSGYDVNYVQNITDVGHLTDDADEGEDKVVREARRRGLHPMAVVETYMRSYLDDMDALNNVRPDIMPRATGHVPEQIAQIQTLLQRGHAYAVNGSVYFDVSSFPGYGKLSGRDFEQMEAGARVDVNPEKRHPADFALWKRAEPAHIMRWPSPWGEGFPGWHIECSAMSQKYLGETFDIHGGGMENKFPHHECEIAQAEGATGRPFVRYWLHNNMCTLNGQKMGKSLGNSISLKDVFFGRPGGVRDASGDVLLDRTFEAVVVRHFVLTSHYRAPLDFSSEALQAAESGCYKLRDAARALARAALARAGGDNAAPLADELPEGPSGHPRALPPSAMAATPRVRDAMRDIETRFAEAMNEDFNTAAAIAVLFDFVRLIGDWTGAGLPAEDLLAADLLMRRLAGEALGLRWSAQLGGDSRRTDDLIRLLVDLRAEARRNRNFALGDQIRDRLMALGVELRDGPQGTTW